MAAGFGAAAGFAGGPGVAVAAGVVADLEDGAAGRRTGQASADGEQLGLAGRSLQPAGDQVDLVGQMPRRRPLEHLRRNLARRRQAVRHDALRQQLVGDPHSPGMIRAVAPLRNIDAWYDAFGVKPGDKLYIPPEDRVRIW